MLIKYVSLGRVFAMKYISGLYTDVGIKKKTNQDSMLLLHAMTDYGEAVFAVVCDGMGGLQKGELASAEVVRACSKWFKEVFPTTIAGGKLDAVKLQSDWSDLIDDQSNSISRYGVINKLSLGTTITCLLIFGGRYYVANVGDSRVYLIKDQVYQITHDQTLVQQKIDNGIITVDQAQNDPERSILLQCIGASDFVKPDFFTGAVEQNTVFMLCCDGFRHMITPQEFYSYLNASKLGSQDAIEGNLRVITELLKQRRETDNISAIAIRTY
ncbi:MAG: serine/threonine-protein phosphatase [Oscillospiraceae bacterium]|nr:serine/threonine-protein phosphatase [Oscillospiraceae bacterium]